MLLSNSESLCLFPSQHRPSVSLQHHKGHCSGSTLTRKRLKDPSNQMEDSVKRCCRIVSRMLLLSQQFLWRWDWVPGRCAAGATGISSLAHMHYWEWISTWVESECSNNMRSDTNLFKPAWTLHHKISTWVTCTLALPYQSCIETCADLSAGVMVLKDLSVIHENLKYLKRFKKAESCLKIAMCTVFCCMCNW